MDPRAPLGLPLAAPSAGPPPEGTGPEPAEPSPAPRRRRGIAGAVLDAANELAFRLVWLTGLVVCRVVFRMRVENPPRISGPFILAPNHASFIDPVVLQCAISRRIVYLMTEAYWSARGANWMFRLWRTLPVRTTGEGNRRALAAAVEQLRRGSIVAIFPEGTRSRDGTLGIGRPGMAMLAHISGAPLVPVALIGTHGILPVGAALPRFARLRVRFGDPVALESRPGAPRREQYEATTRAWTTAMQRLLGERPAGG